MSNVDGIEKPTEVTAGSTRRMTDDQLLDLSVDDSDKGDVSSDSSTHTVVPETFSDNDSDFTSDLPTVFAGKNQTPLAKDGDVESDKPEIEQGKSAKTVPVEATIESPEIEMASKPLEVKDVKIIETTEKSRSKKSSDLRTNDS